MSRTIGDVFLWTSNWNDSGMVAAVACDGQTYPVTGVNEGLAVVAYQYPGGSISEDSKTFTMPDLLSSAPSGLVPYMISTGDFPSPIAFDDYAVTDEPFIGEVDYTRDAYPASGWAVCDGSLLSINQNTTLFAVIGISFGGDGKKTFALPNLIGAVTTPSDSLPVIATTGYYPQRG
jgi:microcystin-dependent protein